MAPSVHALCIDSCVGGLSWSTVLEGRNRRGNADAVQELSSGRSLGCRNSTRIAYTSGRLGKRSLDVRAAGAEFGARDPFPAEIASNFSDKVLGYGDTEHVILVPNAPVLGLAQQSCTLPLPEGTSPFSNDEAKALLRKIVGWRLVDEHSSLKLQCEWRLKDHEAGVELSHRISTVAGAEKKPMELHLDDQTHILRAEIWTESIGGLCENDFILAAKIDQVKTSDLIKQNRFWA